MSFSIFLPEIERILPKELPAKDWDLLVAHSLGVDHCGHKHGPYHAEMKRKLTEVDQMIRGIISQMQDNTVLFVIGDHGMTDTGDHGGESEAETNALLFAYSKGYPFLELRETPVEDSMQQIDFVPVLSSILGVPVPFSNLGTINVNLLPDAPFRDWTKHQVVLQSVWQNARQVQSYFESYAQDNEATFEEDVIESLENKFLTLSYRVSSIYSDSAFQNFEKDLRTHLRSILTICRDVWVRFDPLGMQQGLLIVIFAVILQFLLVSNLNAKQLDAVFNTKTIQMIYLLNVGAAVFVFFGNSASTAAFLSGKFNVVLVTCLLSVVILAFVLVQSWLEVVERWSENRSVTNMLTRCLYGGFVCVFFSNSFVVQEQKIVTYLLAGIVCCSAWKLQRHFNYKQGHKWSHRMVYLTILSLVSYALFLLRLAHLYFKCREEQGDCMGAGGEDVTEVLGMAKYISRYLKLGSLCDKIDVTSIVSMALFVTVCRLFLQSCGAFMGYSLKGILNKFGPSAMAICVGAHFVLANNKVAASYPIQVDSMAWVVYVMFLVQVVVCVTRPLMTYLVDRRSKTEVQSSQVIPEIFNKLRNLYQKSEQPHIPIVYGLPTMYSTALVAFLVFLVLLLSLLLGANAANGLFMALAVAATVVFLQSVVHYNSTDSLEALMNPKFFTLVSWAVLIQFTFYVTSHQPTLSQIDWRAAFVGRTFYQDNSNVVSGVLVLSNIFCGVILFGLMFPMLIIGPFLIYVKYPEFKEVFRKRVQNSEQRRQMGAKRTSAKGEEEQSTDYKIESLSQNNEDAEVEQEATGFDVTRGELNLYENERCLLVTGFRVASKLLLLQGFRVSGGLILISKLRLLIMVFSFLLDFLFDVGMHHSLSPSDGVEDLCAAVYLRGNRHIYLCSRAAGGIRAACEGSPGSCAVDS